jgi:hypothetical protein
LVDSYQTTPRLIPEYHNLNRAKGLAVLYRVKAEAKNIISGGYIICLCSFYWSRSISSDFEMILKKFYIENFYQKPA